VARVFCNTCVTGPAVVRKYVCRGGYISCYRSFGVVPATAAFCVGGFSYSSDHLASVPFYDVDNCISQSGSLG
jgi:hypothetical protein